MFERLLFILSAAVALLLINEKDAWVLIVAYWLVLVIKNGVEVGK